MTKLAFAAFSFAPTPATSIRCATRSSPSTLTSTTSAFTAACFTVTADIAAEHRAASRLLLELPLGDNTFIIILDTTIAPPETTT